MNEMITPAGKLSAGATGLALELALEDAGFPDTLAFTGDKYTDWGHEHEGAARKMFAEYHPEFLVEEVGFVLHGTNLIGASPDGLLWDESRLLKAGLELKCPKATTHMRWTMEGILPDEHKAQCHGGMLATGLDEWWFMSYYPGLLPFIVRVARSAWTDKLEAAVASFAIQLERAKVFVDSRKETSLI
jgi:hypothetical protein